MKYIQTVQAFYERLEMIPLSVGAIALWHALMHMNHKQNGVKEFTAASRALCFKSGLAENMVEETRQELLQKGFIRYEVMDDDLGATYTLCSLGTESERDEKQIDQHTPEIRANETDHHVPEIRTEQMNHSESAPGAGRVDHNEFEGGQRVINHSEPGADQETNADRASCRLQAQLKKLEMHDKLLQKGWQQSVNMTLTDVKMNGELLSALQQYQSGDAVSIVIHTDRSRLAEEIQDFQEIEAKQDKSSNRQVKEPSKQNQSSHTKRGRQGHSDQTKTSPRTKTRVKGKRKQPKRGPASLNAGSEEEIISMGPFEDSPTADTGKEKIIQEMIF